MAINRMPSPAVGRLRAPGAVLAETQYRGIPPRGLVALSLALYLATLSIDALRKVAGLPAGAIGIIYVITALIYVLVLPRAGRSGGSPGILLLWLFLLSAWSLLVALIEHIPLELALLGWASYVFFVPLAYIGAESHFTRVLASGRRNLG